jgi:hypothetical protein
MQAKVWPFYLAFLLWRSRCPRDGFSFRRQRQLAGTNHSGQMAILGGVAMHRNIKSQGSTEELEAQLVLAPNRGCGHETPLIVESATLLTVTGITQC